VLSEADLRLMVVIDDVDRLGDENDSRLDLIVSLIHMLREAWGIGTLIAVDRSKIGRQSLVLTKYIETEEHMPALPLVAAFRLARERISDEDESDRLLSAEAALTRGRGQVAIRDAKRFAHAFSQTWSDETLRGEIDIEDLTSWLFIQYLAPEIEIPGPGGKLLRYDHPYSILLKFCKELSDNGITESVQRSNSDGPNTELEAIRAWVKDNARQDATASAFNTLFGMFSGQTRQRPRHHGRYLDRLELGTVPKGQFRDRQIKKDFESWDSSDSPTGWAEKLLDDSTDFERYGEVATNLLQNRFDENLSARLFREIGEVLIARRHRPQVLSATVLSEFRGLWRENAPEFQQSAEAVAKAAIDAGLPGFAEILAGYGGRKVWLRCKSRLLRRYEDDPKGIQLLADFGEEHSWVLSYWLSGFGQRAVQQVRFERWRRIGPCLLAAIGTNPTLALRLIAPLFTSTTLDHHSDKSVGSVNIDTFNRAISDAITAEFRDAVAAIDAERLYRDLESTPGYLPNLLASVQAFVDWLRGSDEQLDV